MANQEHLAILAKGVDDWNAWRKKNPLTAPDLEDANLRGADLHGADLGVLGVRLSNLVRTDLSGANLSGAVLMCACLTDAKLDGANLSGANLFGAILIETNLSGADLSGAGLALAELRRPTLVGAKFNGSQMSGTLLVDADLRNCEGLETVIHYAPSTIGIDTVYRSEGKIPESFLRGAGVPENLITFMKSLTGAALDFYSCFISYSTKDQEFADRIYADLQAKGVRCWFAPHDIQGGRKVHEQIDEAIRVYDKLLLILSEASMNSNWVKTEIANAHAKEEQQKRQMLFPLSLVPFRSIRTWKLFDAETGIDSAREVREYFIPDFCNWKDHDLYTIAFNRLLRDLKAQPGDKAP